MNPRLAPMKTQTQVHRLEGGQALALHRGHAGRVVLVRGELLVQQPARWLGGVVLIDPPQRIVAPALLADPDSLTIVALRASSVVEESAAPWFTREALQAAAAWLRARLPRLPAVLHRHATPR